MCVMRVAGRNFDPEAFLAATELTADLVYHAGETKSLASRPDGKRREDSGFTISVSDASWGDLAEQVRHAVRFVQEHHDVLARLRSTPGVEDMRLDFPVELRIGRNDVVFQSDYFPPELVSLAGALGFGLELSIYPRDVEQPDSMPE